MKQDTDYVPSKSSCCVHQWHSFPGASDGKESAWTVEDLALISGLGGSPGGGFGNPLQYSCLENPHGQRSLVGYSPWGHRESDTTGRLSTAREQSQSCHLKEGDKADFHGEKKKKKKLSSKNC